MEKTLRMSLLFDFYGPLLTDRQQDVYQMYFHEDLSLGEISEQLGVSRQAVYDMLKRSGAAVEDFEEKLELVSKYQARQENLAEVQKILRELRRKMQHQLSAQAECPACMDLLTTVEERIQQIKMDS